MSVFQKRLNELPLQKELQELSKELGAVLKKKPKQEQAEIIRRTKRILDRFLETISETDPELITLSMLENPDQNVNALREAITTSKESGDWGALVKRGDALLQHLSNFVTPKPPASADKDYRVALDEYREWVAARLEESEKEIKQQLKALTDAKARIDEQAQEVTESVKATKQSIATIQDGFHQLEDARMKTEEQLQVTRGEVDRLSEQAEKFLAVIEKDSQERAEKLRAEHEEWLKKQKSRWNELQSQKETEFSGKVNEWSTSFTDAENKRQQEFTAQQNARSNDFSAWKSEKNTETDELITGWRKHLSTAHKEQAAKADEFSKDQANRFAELQEKISLDASNLLKQNNDAAEDARKSESTAAKQHLESIVSLEREARKLVGIIGNTGVTGNYQKIADQEHQTANVMRCLTIASLTGLVGLAIWTVWNFNTTELRWEDLALRLVAGLPFAAIAWYCGSESRKHRINEQRNRRIELELASLEPYLYQLSDEKAGLVRETLTPKYFGNDSSEMHKVDGQPLDAVLRDALKPLEPIADFAKRFLK